MTTLDRTNLSSFETLHALQQHLKALEAEHESKQLEYKQLYAHHGEKCAVSLKRSVQSLFEVIVIVRKADTKLIQWHHRSKGLKTALRLVGVDRRTNAVIEKKTQKLQNKVQDVERRFDRTGLVFDGGLQEAGRLRSGFLEFSTSEVGKVTDELWSARDDYGEKYHQADNVVQEHRTEYYHAKSGADEITERLDVATQKYNVAELTRNAWGFGTIACLGAAAVSSTVFLPLSVPLLAASYIAGSNTISSSKPLKDLNDKKEVIAEHLSRHNVSVRAAEARLVSSSQARDAYSDAINQVDLYQQTCASFVAESQRSLNELYTVQIVLEKTREKLRTIANELHECRYEDTRQGIAMRLRGILGDLQGVPKKLKSSDEIDFTMATRELMKIDDKTEEVLQIAKLSR